MRVLVVQSLMVLGGLVMAQRGDDRCLLESGGSTQRFFVKEDLPVGSVLGKLSVKGTVDSDISLTLSSTEQSPALQVEIINGTAYLVLSKELDREGVVGPDSLTASILCQRLGTQDPGFVIPVSVRVTDVNDNAPQFLGAPYSLNISELAMVGTELLRVEAVDADQRGPFSTVEYSLERGQFSDYLQLDNTLSGTLRLAKALDYEKVQELEVRLLARDQGEPPQYSSTSLVIRVEDADDQNPVFSEARYEAVLPSPGLSGAVLSILPSRLEAKDRDLGINSSVFYSWAGAGPGYRHFNINSSSGEVSLSKDLTQLEEFVQPVTLIVSATQQDNPDRYSITTLTVARPDSVSLTRGGRLSFSREEYSGRVLENMPLNSVLLTLVTTHSTDRLQFSIIQDDLPGDEFSVGGNGDLILRKKLDYETRQNYSFRVEVTNGRENDTATVNISVLNINDWDPRFRYPQYEFYVSSDAASAGEEVGALEVFDGDREDKISLEISGQHARVFGITEEGELFLSDLSYLTGSDAHIVVTAQDSGSPPRRASVPVLVRFASSVTSPRELAGSTPDTTLVIILCSVSTVFIIIILGLGGYICRYNRLSKAASEAGSPIQSSDSDSMYLQQHFPSQIGHVNLSYKMDPSSGLSSRSLHSTAIRPASASSDKSAVTMASLVSVPHTSLQSSGSSVATVSGKGRKQVKNKSNRVTPADLQPLPDINTSGLPSQVGLQEELKTNIMLSSGRIEWPRGSIPRTVKKLSWDDETDRDREVPIFMDVDVSLTPSAKNSRVAGDPVQIQ